MSDWTKLTPIKGHLVCRICNAGSHDHPAEHSLLAVGFGGCSVTRDGKEVYSEQQAERDGANWTCAEAEQMAADDPDHDWRIHFFAPMYEAEYQRQGERHWPLIKKGQGFA